MSEVIGVGEIIANRLQDLDPGQCLEMKLSWGDFEETWYSFNNNSEWRFVKNIEPLDEDTISDNEILTFDQMVKKSESADQIHFKTINLNENPLDIEAEIKIFNGFLITGVPADLERRLVRLVFSLDSSEVLTIVFGDGPSSQTHEFSTWFAVKQLNRIIFIENISEDIHDEDTAEINQRLDLKEFMRKLESSYSSGHTVFYRNVKFEF